MEDLKKAIKTGLGGFKAMTIQVVSLMWLRTIMNYQYKYGTSFKETFLKLYKEGGIKRFYSGLIPALIQGPISRFGDTFSNAIILNLLKNSNMPIFIKTIFASSTAGIVRIIITPIDTFKTMYQVEGKNAKDIINEKFKTNGIISLYQGAFANGFLTLIGHYPWFVVHNYLNNYIPKYEDKLFKNLLRNAFIGFLSSFISDGITNSFRVIKTAKQTDKNNKGYYEIGEEIIKKNGFKGLFFRGLETRILTNGIQGLMFNVLWKFFDINKKSKANIFIDLKDKN
jgi:hypothetical protein